MRGGEKQARKEATMNARKETNEGDQQQRKPKKYQGFHHDRYKTEIKHK